MKFSGVLHVGSRSWNNNSFSYTLSTHLQYKLNRVQHLLMLLMFHRTFCWSSWGRASRIASPTTVSMATAAITRAVYRRMYFYFELGRSRYFCGNMTGRWDGARWGRRGRICSDSMYTSWWRITGTFIFVAAAVAGRRWALRRKQTIQHSISNEHTQLNITRHKTDYWAYTYMWRMRLSKCSRLNHQLRLENDFMSGRVPRAGFFSNRAQRRLAMATWWRRRLSTRRRPPRPSHRFRRWRTDSVRVLQWFHLRTWNERTCSKILIEWPFCKVTTKKMRHTSAGGPISRSRTGKNSSPLRKPIPFNIIST